MLSLLCACKPARPANDGPSDDSGRTLARPPDQCSLQAAQNATTYEELTLFESADLALARSRARAPPCPAHRRLEDHVLLQLAAALAHLCQRDDVVHRHTHVHAHALRLEDAEMTETDSRQ